MLHIRDLITQHDVFINALTGENNLVNSLENMVVNNMTIRNLNSNDINIQGIGSIREAITNIR